MARDSTDMRGISRRVLWSPPEELTLGEKSVKYLCALSGMVALVAGASVVAAPPDFGLCDTVTVENGLRGMCYGYQASGCSYESEEQNCIQLELIYAEKAAELGLDPTIPGSRIPCLVEATNCRGTRVTYVISSDTPNPAENVICDFMYVSVDECASELNDICYGWLMEDFFSAIRSQVESGKTDICEVTGTF